MPDPTGASSRSDNWKRGCGVGREVESVEGRVGGGGQGLCPVSHGDHRRGLDFTLNALGGHRCLGGHLALGP